MNLHLRVLGAVGLLATMASSAQAQLSANALSCNNGGAMALMFPAAIDCSGAWNGNINNQPAGAVINQLNTDFGAAFTLIGYSDDVNNGPFTGSPGTTTGTLSFDAARFGLFALGLKSSTQFSFYLFDGGTTGISSIDYTTVGTSVNKNGVAQDLSHAALYQGPVPTITTTTAVPEPGTYAMLLSGMAVLGLVIRRRRR